jgi:hypothetical protein
MPPQDRLDRQHFGGDGSSVTAVQRKADHGVAGTRTLGEQEYARGVAGKPARDLAVQAELLQKAFLDAYRKAAKGGGGQCLEAGLTFYQANWEFIILGQAAGKPDAVAQEAAARLAAILGVQ